VSNQYECDLGAEIYHSVVNMYILYNSYSSYKEVNQNLTNNHNNDYFCLFLIILINAKCDENVCR